MNTRKTQVGFVIAALLIGIFVAAMDNTIVATAMGTIVSQLGGLDKFVWVTSAYLVTEMAGMPIFGKLSDMYGRKRFFIFGLTVFLIGSMLSGTADNMVQLSLYRALQGIGGGALMPIAFTIIFDVVPPARAGKMSGMFGAVFGMASIFGPLLGAYITEHVSWRWIFYINVPFGIVALVFIIFFYHESVRHSRQQIDWQGAITLVPAVVSLMFALELGGSKYAWNSVEVIGLFVVSAVLLIAFFIVEKKVPDPIISYAMFNHRLFAGSNLVGLFSSGAYIVAVVYIPIFVQGVQGGSATNSALVLLPMMLGSSLSAPIGGQLANRFSYRRIMLGFTIVFAVGIYLLSTISADTSRLTVTLYMIVVGLGIGASFSVLGMAAMHHFDQQHRGSASSTLSFIRELGMTLGITVFGIVQRNVFAKDVKKLFTGMGNMAQVFGKLDPRAMLSPQTREHMPSVVLDKLMQALSTSIAHIFLWTLVPALLAIVFVFWLSKEHWGRFAEAAQDMNVEPQARDMYES